jgi:hypothetical protein
MVDKTAFIIKFSMAIRKVILNILRKVIHVSDSIDETSMLDVNRY